MWKAYVFTVKMVLLSYSKSGGSRQSIFTRKKLLFLPAASWFRPKVAHSWLPSYLSLCYCDSDATFTVCAQTVNVARERVWWLMYYYDDDDMYMMYQHAHFCKAAPANFLTILWSITFLIILRFSFLSVASRMLLLVCCFGCRYL